MYASHSNVQAKRGCEYFINLKDDYLCYSQAYLIRLKFDTFEMFKEYRASVKRKLGIVIKILRSDRDEEY